jgi:hypothetical protein
MPARPHQNRFVDNAGFQHHEATCECNESVPYHGNTWAWEIKGALAGSGTESAAAEVNERAILAPSSFNWPRRRPGVEEG